MHHSSIKTTGHPMLVAVLIVAAAISGCRNDMHDQPKYKPLRKTSFFADSLSSRPPVPGTVARGAYQADRMFYTGEGAQTATAAPQSTVTTQQQTGEQVVPTGQTTPEGTARPDAERQVTGQQGAGAPATPAGSPAVQGTGAGKFTATFPMAVTRELLLRGKERYNINCAPCHGKSGDGKGFIVQRGFQTMPPSFHIDRLRNAPAGHFFDVITHGFGAMYSYANRVKPEDRWAITAYIRALQRSQMATQKDVPAGIDLDAPPPSMMNSHANGHNGQHAEGK